MIPGSKYHDCCMLHVNRGGRRYIPPFKAHKLKKVITPWLKTEDDEITNKSIQQYIEN